jgi:signal transduction histidine kinase
MIPARRGQLISTLLLSGWLVVVCWQVEEHLRVVEAAKSDLRHRSHEIASTLSAVTRALRFRGATPQERLDPVLNELVNNRTNELVKSIRLISVGLLNTDGDPIVAVGDTNLLSREILAERERWSDNYVTFIWPVDGASGSPEGTTNNPTVVLPRFPRFTNDAARNGRDFLRREPRPDETNFPGPNEFSATNFPPPPTNGEMAGETGPPSNDGNRPPDGGDRSRGGSRRPPWMRGMSDADFKALVAKRELHGLVLAMSTDNYREVCTDDWWLRGIICFFAGISVLGAGLALRNNARTAELQIRLVRAAELNSHLKEMNLAAAGLAHETRNPLNIIRGLAQMISRQTAAPAEIRDQSKTIVDQTDKVTAQLTEFIDYSRPREVRRTKINLTAAINEVIRTVSFDLGEKKLHVETGGDPLIIQADEQLLRQVLFNLLFNAIQAADSGGQIQFVLQRTGATEGALEIRDDGPGVVPANRQEIFKPYFTTHQKGTGLGLAVVQQIVLAHGWEIECLGNEPRGAIFRITHLKLAA